MSVQLKGSGTIGGLDEGLVVSGIVTSSTQINVGSNIKLGNAGVITATSFVGSGANLTGIDATKIETGNTKVETVDTGSDGHVKVTTENVERFRIHNDGTIGIGQSSKSSTVGAGGLDIQGNVTNCIIEMGNPFPGFSGGVVPELRITATNSGHEVKFESIWGGDNALHPHLAFTGGRTHFYRGTNSDEIARFDADKFWIGTTSGQGKFEVYDGTIVHSKPSGGGTRNYRFVNNNTAAGDYGIQISSTSGGSTYVNHTELKAGGDVHIHDGNLKLASGHGIDFYAYATSGNPSSNLLDDYEEGSWNPEVLNGWGILSPTYSEQDGKYIKIGRLVYVIFRLKLNGGSTNGNRIAIANFPFNAVTIGTSGYAAGGYAALNGYCDTASSNASSVFCMVGRSTTTAELFHRTSTGESSFTGTELGNSGSLNFSGCYMTP